jgi:hypothetical protein
MPDLNFTIDDARALPHAVSPHIAFKLRIANTGAEPIHSVILRSQIQLDASRRRYTAGEQKRLADLFGAPQRWNETLRSMLWTNTSVIVPGFTGTTQAELQIPCTFDFNVAATKYLEAIDDGEVPLTFFFNGTVFYSADEDRLQVVHIPWEKEAAFRMPIRVWREMMDMYYPNTAWLCLARDAFDRLYQYKVQHGLPTFEAAIERMSR